MMNKIQEKKQCPLCEEVVKFAELQTRSEIDTAEGIKLVQAVVLRCPECKRIIGPVMPVNDQDRE